MTLLLSIFLNKKNGKVQSKIVHHVVNGNGSTFFNWSWLFAKKKIKCVALSTPWRAFHSATGLYLPSNSFRNSATSYQDIIARAFFFFWGGGGGFAYAWISTKRNIFVLISNITIISVVAPHVAQISHQKIPTISLCVSFLFSRWLKGRILWFHQFLSLCRKEEKLSSLNAVHFQMVRKCGNFLLYLPLSE